jgi:hypothetical protein
MSGAPKRIEGTSMHMPEAGKVLCLKIFGAVLYFKFYSVIFAEAFVPVSCCSSNQSKGIRRATNASQRVPQNERFVHAAGGFPEAFICI